MVLTVWALELLAAPAGGIGGSRRGGDGGHKGRGRRGAEDFGSGGRSAGQGCQGGVSGEALLPEGAAEGQEGGVVLRQGDRLQLAGVELVQGVPQGQNTGEIRLRIVGGDGGENLATVEFQLLVPAVGHAAHLGNALQRAGKELLPLSLGEVVIPGQAVAGGVGAALAEVAHIGEHGAVVAGILQ